MATLKSKSESTPRHAGATDVLTTQRYLLFAQTAQASGLQHAATVFRAVAGGAHVSHDDAREALSASAMSVAGKSRVSRALPGR